LNQGRHLLAKHRVITTIAVHDIQNALDFYGSILGLKRVEENKAGYLFESGGGLIGLHQSPTAGSGQGTCAWWIVDDVDKIVKKLKSRGVTFETNYDLPRTKRKGDIYLMSDTKRAAWFKDPDGNILGIGNF
jgi:catechol 2,3-dioxygenase-like lactoylglutathione lyase family enzyme